MGLHAAAPGERRRALACRSDGRAAGAARIAARICALLAGARGARKAWALSSPLAWHEQVHACAKVCMACLCSLPRHAAASKLTCAACAAGAGSARRSRATTKRRASARAGHLPAPAVLAAAAAAAAAARRLRRARGAIGAPGALVADRRLAGPAAMARCRASIAIRPACCQRSCRAAKGLNVWMGTLLVQRECALQQPTLHATSDLALA